MDPPQSNSLAARPSAAHTAITGIMPALKRNSATKAAAPMRAEAQSKGPDRPPGHRTGMAWGGGRGGGAEESGERGFGEEPGHLRQRAIPGMGRRQRAKDQGPERQPGDPKG